MTATHSPPSACLRTGKPPAVLIENVQKWFGDFHVLRDISLTVQEGEKIVICGPSGSGKSTLIRCLNGLERHDGGRIVVDGTELTRDLGTLDKIRSEVGMVFQSFNLFPHLSVLDNLCLAPQWVRGVRKADAEAAALALLERVRIADQARKFPEPAFGRAAAARGHCAGARHEPAHHAVRRADERARSGDGEGSARCHDRARPVRA